jgi:hypothetical protein
MTRIKQTNPQNEARLRGLIARIAQTPMGETLLQNLEDQAQEYARYTYVCFDRQMAEYGACYNRASIKTVALNPDIDDDLLVSVLMHELVHGAQPSLLPSIETNAPVTYGTISMRLCEGHAFTEQLLFLRQLETCDAAAAKAGRRFMLDGRFSENEMTVIDEAVTEILASKNEHQSRHPRETLFWMTQEYIKRRYDISNTDKIHLLMAGKGQSNLLDAHASLQRLFSQYDEAPALLPQLKGFLWVDANRNNCLIEMLAAHSGVDITPSISLKTPTRPSTAPTF